MICKYVKHFRNSIFGSQQIEVIVPLLPTPYSELDNNLCDECNSLCDVSHGDVSRYHDKSQSNDKLQSSVVHIFRLGGVTVYLCQKCANDLIAYPLTVYQTIKVLQSHLDVDCVQLILRLLTMYN